MVEGLRSASVVVAPAETACPRGPRRWAMVILARALSRIVGVPLTDVTSGFRAADRQAIAPTRAIHEYLGDTVESLVMASRAGLRVAQVDVEMRPRQVVKARGPFMSAVHLARAALALVVALSPKPAGRSMNRGLRRPGWLRRC